MNNAFYDLAVTASHRRTTEGIHAFALELASHGSGAGAILKVAEVDPDSPLANAYAAAACLTLMTRAGQQRASKPLAMALTRHDACNTREQQTIAAITAWHLGDEAKAVRILRNIVEIWPHDLAALKLCQILEIGLGDVPGMLRTSGMAAAVEGRSGYAFGLHAFALEQAGETNLAMRFARRAIDLNPGMDPWAEHVVAHVFAANEQPVEGRSFLHAHSGGWDRCSSFMLTHNWWHLALFELELDNMPAAFELLLERIWGVRKEHSQDQINAISLLARLEMDGLRTPDIWEDIARHIETHSDDRMNIFLDLHYLYALAKAGRDGKVRNMLDRFDPQSLAGALAHGVAAHAKREYMLAASMIAPFRRDLQALGGSNVQRELFELIFADSVIRCRDTLVARDRFEPAVQFDVAA
jgi:tetratricopeptide (TPR) repeat protein